MSAPLFLGVDGGGTKTEFLCIDAAGAVRGRAVTGTTYHLEVGVAEAVRRLGEGVASVCTAARIAPAEITAAFFGLPAHGEDAVVDPQLEAACAALTPGARVGNDMVCGWAGSLACEDGVNVVAGTGSIAYGERRGRAARAGGWGEVIGDEGSAYWIASRGLALFSRMSDGRAPDGPLRAMLREALGLEQDLDLCARVMGARALGRGDVAALATIVSAAAAAGDAGARRILADAGAELAALATALRRRLGFADGERVPVSWSGGVLANEPMVRAAFLAGLDADFAPVEPRHAPGYGAALYARHIAGVAATPQ